MGWIKFAAAVAAMLLLSAAPAPQPVPDVALFAPVSGDWTVAYRLARPVRDVVFARNPNDSRVRQWRPEPGFAVVRQGGEERVRRQDGRAFRAVRLQVPPAYVELPADYAPFSPFGDGGLLAYSGRFLACAGPCVEGARWKVDLSAPGRTVLVDGVRTQGRARWRDGGQGRNVYVGSTAPVETPELVTVIDRALPPVIRTQLLDDLPRHMRFFAARLGRLEQRPMLFASYDLAHPTGFGRQGGTLPGQVFVHFYGARWPAEMAKLHFADELAFHFAHEAAHLFQRNVYGEKADYWIHEGGADALAILALRASGPEGVANADILVAAARRRCQDDLDGQSLRDAAAGGNQYAAYRCGMLVSLALHERLGGDGLFALWRAYAQVGPGTREAQFLGEVRRLGGAALAGQLRALVRAPGADMESLRTPA